jgi:general secretion pathway protein I
MPMSETISPCPASGRPPRGEGGFVLLEVLVAFVIAAIALGVLFQVAFDGMRAVHTAAQYEDALSRARSHLDGSFARLVPGDQQGDDGGGFHWRVAIRQIGQVPGKLANADPDADPATLMVRLYAITVRVSWQQSGKTREVRLDSQRLGSVALSR